MTQARFSGRRASSRDGHVQGLVSVSLGHSKFYGARGPMPTCAPAAAALALAQRSSCPASTWMDHVAPVLTSSQLQMTAFVVGANKGYAIVAALQRFGHRSPTMKAWQRELQRFTNSTSTGPDLCGYCCACLSETQRLPGKQRPAGLSVHAFELLDANVVWLKHGLRHFRARPRPSPCP